MSGPAQPVSRAELARAWWRAVSPTAEVRLPRDMLEECLRHNVNRVVDALQREPLDPEPIVEAAAALVARG